MDLKKLDLPGLELVDENADYSESQLFYIDFDGENNVSYNNNALDINIENITIEDSGISSFEQTQIISQLNDFFADTGISFTATAPASGEYSTIYVGSNSDVFSDLGSFAGLSETIDVGNEIKDDDAFVFVDDAQSVISTIVHEAGHLVGYKHIGGNTNSIYDFAAAAVTPINEYESYSMLTDAINAVDLRLAVAGSVDDAKEIFAVQNHDDGLYSRNSDVWVSDVDLTCISPWNSYGGKTRAGTLITSKHIALAKHYALNVGTVLRFVTMDNEVIERTIVSRSSVDDTDCNIAELDEDLPESITSAYVLPSNFDSLLATATDIPGLLLDQQEHAIVGETTTCYESYDEVYWTTVPNSDDTRAEYGEAIIGGDSGNPTFLIVDNQLVLVTTWWKSNMSNWAYGPSITALKFSIQDIIDTLSGSSDYELKTIDVSHYTTYESETGDVAVSDTTSTTKDSGTTEIRDETELQYATSDVDLYGLTVDVSGTDEENAIVFNADDCTLNVYGDINFTSDSSGSFYAVYFRSNSGNITLYSDASINIVMSDSTKAFGIYSYNELTSNGIAGTISLESSATSTYGIVGMSIDFSGGDISGSITVNHNKYFSSSYYDKLYTYGLFSLSDIITANISGTVSVSGTTSRNSTSDYKRGNSLVRVMYAQGNMVIQDITGAISGSSTASSGNNAYADSYGLYALGTMDIGSIAGTVESSAYSSTGEAFSRAIHANGDLTITEISGTVAASATAELWSNVAMANAIRGDVVSGTDGSALVITEEAVVSAYAAGNKSTVANAIVATGGMNLDIAGTVSAAGSNEDGTYRSLYAYGDADDSVLLRNTAAITGDIVLAGGDDSLTLETGLVLELDIDFGKGNDVLAICGASDVFGSAAIIGDISYDGSLTVDFDIAETSAGSTLLNIFSNGIGDSFNLQVDYSKQGTGDYYLINSAEDISSFYSGQTFLINDMAELVVGGDGVVVGTRLYELDVPASTALVLTVVDYDSVAPTTPLGLNSTIYNETATVLLDWSNSTDQLTVPVAGVVAGYVVEYSQELDFSESFTVSTSVSEITVDDVYDGAWYWRVMAVDQSGNVSDWSVTAQFNIDFPDILAPDVPDDLTQVVNDKDVFLDWSDSGDNKSGLKEYVIEYSLNTDFTNAEQVVVTDSELSLAGLDSGYYCWRVKAIDEAGNKSDWNSGAFAIFPDGQEGIVPEGITADSFFGQNVAISGDKFVVGSGLDGQGNAANIIYIFSWNDVTQTWDDTVISVSDVQSSWSNYLDISGDVVVGGDKGDDSSGVSGGGVHVYQWSGAEWQETILTASDAQAGDQFGWTTAIDGDRIVVGARYDDDSGTDAGSAYIYEWNGSSWDETKLLASDGANLDAFGSSVAIDGDRVVVGARLGDVLGDSSGSAYVYSWNDGGWDETKLTASDASENDYFGGSVAIDGDIIVVGASGDDDNGENSGSVYIYRWNGETWEETKLTASDGQANDNFGWSVAVADGDTDTIIVGAHDFDCNGPDSGCAYLYQWNGISWIESKFSAVDVQANDNFGWSLDIDGETIVVGSRKDDAAGDDSGSAYLFELDTVIDSTPPNVPADLVETILGDEVLLDWSDSVDASGGTGVSKYIVEYADNLSFINTNEMIVVNSELTLSGLENGSWYWRVQAVDVASNVSDWSEVYSFEVDVQTLDSLTGLAVTVSGDDISLDWDNAQNVVYGVKNYIIEYSQDAAFTAPVETTSTASALNIVNIAEGNWYWRVRVEDNNAGFSAWTQGENFFVDVSGPSVPTIVSDDVDGDSVVLDWSASTDSGVGLSGYVVQYADNSDFAGALENTLTSSELSLGGLVDGVYYWRVKSYDGNGNDSDWSEEDSFIVDTIAPSVPTGLFDYVDGNDVSLTWYAASDTDGGSGVWEYVVEYADNASFDSAVKMVVDTNELQLDNIDYGTYYWKVQTVDGSGNESAWSVSDTFVTDDTVGNSFADSQVINVDEAYSKAEYVGIGDACDMYSFDVASAGEFDLAISNLSAKTKLNIYVWNGKKYKKIKSTGSKFDKITDQIEAHIDNLMLDEDTYYIEIISGDKGKGKCNTEYSLDITPSYLPEATDNNNWQDATEIFPDVSLDGFVGFGDAVDYYKFEVDSLDVFDFELAGDNKNAKMTVYEWDESKDKYKKVATASLKNGEAMLDDISLDAGLYYVEVLSKDKGKGKYNTEYELNITTA